MPDVLPLASQRYQRTKGIQSINHDQKKTATSLHPLLMHQVRVAILTDGWGRRTLFSPGM